MHLPLKILEMKLCADIMTSPLWIRFFVELEDGVEGDIFLDASPSREK
jgi:hypothetical protein